MYSAEISRRNPTCFIYLIDQSGSMSDPWGGDTSGVLKNKGVADAINRLLSNLIIKCSKSEGIWDYFEIGVIGYGSDRGVSPAFQGMFAGQEIVKISELANNPARIEERIQKISDGAGGIVDQLVKFPIWFEPIAENGTPMCEGISYAKRIVEKWIVSHMESYPPVVINITDGESTDGNPLSNAKDIAQLKTNDGNILFLNCHISSHKAASIIFPDSSAGLPDQYAKLLFDMSSILPEPIINTAQKEGYNLSNQSRGFAFNTDLVELIRFLDIVTKRNLR